MKHIGIRYTLIIGILLVLFANFVACGAKLYQVSLGEDIDNQRTLPSAATDPTSETYGIHAINGWNALPVEYRVDYKMNPQQVTCIQNAMHSWEQAVGKTLFNYGGLHEGVTGDSFPDLYSSLDDEINGEYLRGDWAKTGKPPVVLATTIWDNFENNANVISKADMHFNANYYILGNALFLSSSATQEVVDMESLALHELGHFLGLNHITPDVDANSVMNPTLLIGEGMTYRKLSQGDVERIQRIYGCTDAACNIKELMQKIEFGQTTAANDGAAGQPVSSQETH